MTPGNVRVNALSELARAEESLRAADVLAREGLATDAVSDAYYAAFHAVRALLFTLGLEPRTHGGTLRLFNENFVRTGKLQAGHLATFTRLQQDRADADYGAAPGFTPDQAREAITQAASLVEAVRDLLRAEGIVPG